MTLLNGLRAMSQDAPERGTPISMAPLEGSGWRRRGRASSSRFNDPSFFGGWEGTIPYSGLCQFQ